MWKSSGEEAVGGELVLKVTLEVVGRIRGDGERAKKNVEKKVVSRCVKSLSMRILKNFARVLLG